MNKKIPGMTNAYCAALYNKGDITISAPLLIELIDYIGELENSTIDLRACLRTCANAANGGLEQYPNNKG